MATQVIQIQDLVNEAMLDALVDAIDDGGTGSIEITNGVPEILVTIPFPSPAFANASVDTALWGSGNQQGTAVTVAGTQVASLFNAKDGAGTVIFTGTVGASASTEAIELSNTTLNNNDVVRINESGSQMVKPTGF